MFRDILFEVQKKKPRTHKSKIHDAVSRKTMSNSEFLFINEDKYIEDVCFEPCTLAFNVIILFGSSGWLQKEQLQCLILWL